MSPRRESPPGRGNPLRRALRWLFAGREHIDQEGLLAERTLLTSPRRAHHDEAGDPEAPEPPADERRS
jgi:hypothetical protein